MEDRPSGWYRDPEDYSLERFWDGTRWTSARRPLQRSARSETGRPLPSQKQDRTRANVSSLRPFLPGNSTLDRKNNDNLYAHSLYLALFLQAGASLLYAVATDEYLPGGPFGHPVIAILSMAIVPQIFYRLAGRRFLLARHHSLVMSNFVLWMQIVYLLKFGVDIAFSIIWSWWDNFIGPGFLLEIIWWSHLLMNYTAGFKREKNQGEFRPSLTPWLLGKLHQTYSKIPEIGLALPVQPGSPARHSPAILSPTSGLGSSNQSSPRPLTNYATTPGKRSTPHRSWIIIAIACILTIAGLSAVKQWESAQEKSGVAKKPSSPSNITEIGNQKFKIMSSLRTPKGGIARWNSCQPIQVVLNLDSAPTDAKTLTKIALKNVEQATGLRIEIIGESSEKYSATRKGYQPEAYPEIGKDWAPVLLDWRPREEFLANFPKGMTGTKDVVGIAGPQVQFMGSIGQIVTGAAQFDATWFETTIANGNVTDPTSIIMHEFGHIIGLDHVNDKKEIMNPVENGFTTWGPRDRAGLKFMGEGPCLTSKQLIKPD